MTDPAPGQVPIATLSPQPKVAAVIARHAAGLLLLTAGYEFLLVGFETYAYGLSRRSSYLIFSNVFLVIFLIHAVFRLIRVTIRRARILRPEGWMSLSIISGVLAIYWGWSVDRWLRLGLFGVGNAGLSLSPVALADYLTQFHDKGLWGWGNSWYFDHDTVRGDWLVLWWLLESATILLVPSAMTWRFLRHHPQCVQCGSWMEMNLNVRRMQSSRAARVQEGLREGDFSVLEEPDRPQKGDPFTLRIDLCRCEVCPAAVYLCLTHDRSILLWMHPIPSSQVQKVFKPIRKAKSN